MRSWLARVAAGIALVCVGTLSLSGTASAHSVLLDTVPIAGGTVASSPKQIRLKFNEAVELGFGAIRLFDARGRQIQLGDATHPQGRSQEIAATVPAIPDGSYVISWRALSADSHPINGAFTFAVGTVAAGSDTRGLVARLVDDTGSTTVGVALAMARWVTYIAASISIGGLVLLWLCWGAGWASRRARRGLLWSSGLVAAASVLSIAAQGAYAAGEGAGSMLRPVIWADVMGTRFGQAALVRVVAAIILSLGISALFRGRARLTVWVTALAAATVIFSLAASNHGLTGRWVVVAFVTDVVHLTAMAVWLGGLVGLAAWVLHDVDKSDADGDQRVRAVRRYSTVALLAVAAIVISGVLQAVRQVGSFSGLTSTTYGVTLLVKVALVAVIISVAWVSRRLTHIWADGWRPRPGSAAAAMFEPIESADSTELSGSVDVVAVAVGEVETRRYLRRSVMVEVIVMLLVVGASTVLSNTIPALEAVAIPFKQTIVTDEGFAEILVDPARTGTTDLHVTITDPDGSVPQVEDLTVTVRLRERGVGPLEIPMERFRDVPNHFTAPAASFPFPGVWSLQARARVGQFEDRVFTVQVPVR